MVERQKNSKRRKRGSNPGTAFRLEWTRGLTASIGGMLPVLPVLLFVLAGLMAAQARNGALPADTMVVVEDSQATLRLQPQPERVHRMLDAALMQLTGDEAASNAWGRVAGPQDVVAIKVYSTPGPNSGTRPAVAEGVVRGLLSAGVQATNIILWDRTLVDLRLSSFTALAQRTGVSIQGALQAGYDSEDYYEQPLIASLRFGDIEFGRLGEGVGRRSHVTRLLGPSVTRIISIAPALNRNTTGVTGHLFSLALGAVDNTWRFESNPSSLRTALPELFAMESIGDRVVLCITDALICQYEGENTSLLHYATTANKLMLGADPVALDVLAVELLQEARAWAGSPEYKPDMLVYRNARLLQLGTDNPRTLRIRRIRTDTGDAHPSVPPTNAAAVIPTP